MSFLNYTETNRFRDTDGAPERLFRNYFYACTRTAREMNNSISFAVFKFSNANAISHANNCDPFIRVASIFDCRTQQELFCADQLK